ncbi:hypothetical protein S245_020405 [Arachis hypogaea]
MKNNMQKVIMAVDAAAKRKNSGSGQSDSKARYYLRGGCNHQTAMRVILKSQSMWTVGEVKNRSEIDISLLLTGNDRSGQAYPSEAVRAESF